MKKTTVIRCENCQKSDHCMSLKPCKDFAPEQNSNFLIEVKKLTKPPETELTYVY
jgi:hypothetical protein